MRVLYPGFRGRQQCCQFICAFTLSSAPPRNTPHTLGIPIVSTPNAFRFPVQEHPLALGIPENCPWYRYGYMYFLKSPIVGYLLGENQLVHTWIGYSIVEAPKFHFCFHLSITTITGLHGTLLQGVDWCFKEKFRSTVYRDATVSPCHSFH